MSAVASRPTDGRSARSQRTRDAVVEAVLDLIDDGDLRPTAKRVAEHAGVSLRSVYVHFDDLEDLFMEAAQRQFERVLTVVRPIPRDGRLRDRIEALVAQRARVHDVAGPVRRAAYLHAPSSPAIARALALAHRRSVAELRRVFAIELGACAPARREWLICALDLATQASAWEALRETHGLSPDAARAVTTETLLTLLGADG